MLYRFKSQATADLTMLEAPAKQILQVIGKTEAPQGVILPEEVPAAIAALERAVQTVSNQAKAEPQSDADADDSSDETRVDRSISLAQRVAPFIQMLREASAAGERVTWGV